MPNKRRWFDAARVVDAILIDNDAADQGAEVQQRAALMVVAQLVGGGLHIGDPTLGDAILDRLLHHAHKIHLERESMRKRTGAASDQKPPSKPKKID